MEGISIRIKELIEALKVSQNTFASSLEASSSRLSNITTGRNKPDFDMLSAIAEKYRNVNLDWLLTGKGSMFRNVNTDRTISIEENAKPVVIPGSTSGTDSKSKHTLPGFIRNVNYDTTSIPVKVMDVEAAAAAFTGGYLAGAAEVLEIINLPAAMLGRGGEYYAFKVRNDSMHPTIYVGDYIVAQLLTPSQYEGIRDNYIYVVICKENGVVVKRLLNRLSKYGFLRCRSDNRYYPPFNVDEHNIVAVLEVKLKISGNLPNENQNLFETISAIQERLETLEIAQKKQ